MNAQKMLAIVLIVAGGLGLAYGGFSYTKETHKAELGPIKMSIDEKQQVNIPVWVGIGMLTFGGLLLVVGKNS